VCNLDQTGYQSCIYKQSIIHKDLNQKWQNEKYNEEEEDLVEISLCLSEEFVINDGP